MGFKKLFMKQCQYGRENKKAYVQINLFLAKKTVILINTHF